MNKRKLVILLAVPLMVLAGILLACALLSRSTAPVPEDQPTATFGTQPSETVNPETWTEPETEAPTEPTESPTESTETEVPTESPPHRTPMPTWVGEYQSAAPTQPKPTEPKPTTPKPTQPKPTAPKPTEAEDTQPGPRKLKAKSYFVYDCTADAFVNISGQADARIYPASITKLFTAYVALQYLSADTVVTVGEERNLVIAAASVAGLRKGNRLRVDMLVEGMLLPSGCDASYTLAAAAGRVLLGDDGADAKTAVYRFLQEMNDQAKALGMTGTHFDNPDGIQGNTHYTTPQDMVKIAKLSLANPVIAKYAATQSDTVTFASGQKASWSNTNLLISKSSAYYCPYAIGLKTGQTSAAGGCLLSAFQVGDRTILIGVFGGPWGSSRFEDTLQLFNEWLETAG